MKIFPFKKDRDSQNVYVTAFYPYFYFTFITPLFGLHFPVLLKINFPVFNESILCRIYTCHNCSTSCKGAFLSTIFLTFLLFSSNLQSFLLCQNGHILPHDEQLLLFLVWRLNDFKKKRYARIRGITVWIISAAK